MIGYSFAVVKKPRYPTRSSAFCGGLARTRILLARSSKLTGSRVTLPITGSRHEELGKPDVVILSMMGPSQIFLED